MSGARKYTTITYVEWGLQVHPVGSCQRKDFEGGYQIEIYCVENGRDRKYGALLAHNNAILHCIDYPSPGSARKDCIARIEAHKQAARTIPIVQRKRAA